MSFHWFDLVAGVLLLVFILYSSLRGIVKEFFSVSAWVIGYLGTILLHAHVAGYAGRFAGRSIVADLIVFFVLFILLYAGVRLLGFLLNKKLGLDRIPAAISHSSAAIMGVAKWFFFVAIVLSPLNLFPEIKSNLTEKSIVAAMVNQVSAKLSVSPVSVDTAGPEKLGDEIKRAGEKARKSLQERSRELTEGEKKKPEPAGKTGGEPSENEKDRKGMDKLLESIS